jgi:hypothetical protein
LRGEFVKAQLKVRPACSECHVDGGIAYFG